MPGRRKADREVKAAQRRNKKEYLKSSEMGTDCDDFNQLNNQLHALGLVLKQIPGDGNCLFRALGDQLTGNSYDHLNHRSDVVRYMLEHRDDFEPFVEDDITFDEHVRNLSEAGTFGGNDSIVAFARLHNLTVVIHQLNKPLWQIHGGRDGSPGLKEAHISYHNGDHYNSVRRCGELDGPAGIRLSSIRQQPVAAAANRFSNQNKQNNLNHRQSEESEEDAEDSDYENHPNSIKLEKLVQEVSRLSGGTADDAEILHALHKNAFSIQSSVEYLARTRRDRKHNQTNRVNSIWSEQGTGSRIIGNQVGENYRPKHVPNKNLSAKRQKEMKKREQRLEKDRSKGQQRHQQQIEEKLDLPNLQTLTI